MKKSLVIALSLALVICVFTGCGGKTTEPEVTPTPTPEVVATPAPTATPEPQSFSSVLNSHAVNFATAADETTVYNALSAAWTAEEERIAYGGEGTQPFVPEDGALTLSADGAASYEAVGTPVSDGERIYMLSGTTLRILRADGSNTTQLNAMEVGSSWSDTQEGKETTWGGFEKYPTNLYLAEGKLIVLSNWYGYEAYMQDNVNVCDYTEYTCVDIYDLTDPVSPVLTASFGQDGSCTGVDVADGMLYLATEYAIYKDADAGDSSDFLPAFYTNGVPRVLEASKVILADDAVNSVYGMVGVYDLSTASCADVKAVLGANGDVVMAAPCVYLTAENYALGDSVNYRDNIYDVTEYASVACTDVYRMEWTGSALEMKNSASVAGHLSGERAVAMVGDTIHLATREENFRYTLYVDAERGFENILWGSVEQGDSMAALTAQLQPSAGEKANVFRGYLYNWTEGNYVGLSRDAGGALKLALYSASLQEITSKTFGNDYSKTLSSSEAIYVNGEKNVIGFAADDGYSFYRYEEENGFTSIFDAYITDWPWHVRCIAVGDNLYMTDRTTVYIYSLTDMTLVHTLTL